MYFFFKITLKKSNFPKKHGPNENQIEVWLLE